MIFGKEPFGELERLTTQKLLDVAQEAARKELDDEDLLRLATEPGGQTNEQVRVSFLEFLDTDVFHVSLDNCVHFLDPLIESWDIDLETFAMEVVLKRGPANDRRRRFAFMECEPERLPDLPPGLDEFLEDDSLSGDATEEGIGLLKGLQFGERRPTPLYYYRALQNLRDPLHFLPGSG